MKILPWGVLTSLLSLQFISTSPVKLGSERIFEAPHFSWIEGKRVGLITNHTGVNHDFESTARILEADPRITVAALFAPEHGIAGGLQAGVKFESTKKIFSLYGDTRRPTPEMLQDIDVLLYDIQDVGARFYTYTSTLFECMKAAAEKGIPLIVLDRPSPIRGDRTEGPPVESGFESFVGLLGLPMRHGLTPGELALYLNGEFDIGADVRVVPLQGWRRDLWLDQTDAPWAFPSPNMPTLDTATVYPGFCLFEGTNLSEGRGTTRPFEVIGAPWLRNQELVDRLNQLGLPGVRFRAQSFTPSFSKYSSQFCAGIQTHVVDRDRFQPVRTALAVLLAVRDQHPQEFKLTPGFNRLAGNAWLGNLIEQGTPLAEAEKRWESALDRFNQARKKYLLY